jgi:hypothetical protein
MSCAGGCDYALVSAYYVWTPLERRRVSFAEEHMYGNLSRTLFCGVAMLPALALAQTVPLTQDSYVVPFTVTNYGSAVTIDVGGPSGAAALVQFDLTTLPSGITGSNLAKAA